MAEKIPAAELVHDGSIDLTQTQDLNKPVEKVSCVPVEVVYKVQGINIDGSGVLLSDTFA